MSLIAKSARSRSTLLRLLIELCFLNSLMNARPQSKKPFKAASSFSFMVSQGVTS